MARLGVPASVVINMLYKQIIMTRSIPFPVPPARSFESGTRFRKGKCVRWPVSRIRFPLLYRIRPRPIGRAHHSRNPHLLYEQPVFHQGLMKNIVIAAQ